MQHYKCLTFVDFTSFVASNKMALKIVVGRYRIIKSNVFIALRMAIASPNCHIWILLPHHKLKLEITNACVQSNSKSTIKTTIFLLRFSRINRGTVNSRNGRKIDFIVKKMYISKWRTDLVIINWSLQKHSTQIR